jgi:hypothetical protein
VIAAFFTRWFLLAMRWTLPMLSLSLEIIFTREAQVTSRWPTSREDRVFLR